MNFVPWSVSAFLSLEVPKATPAKAVPQVRVLKSDSAMQGELLTKVPQKHGSFVSSNILPRCYRDCAASDRVVGVSTGQILL